MITNDTNKSLFFIATVDGEMPTKPEKNEKDLIRHKQLAEKGWPEKKWKSYEIRISKTGEMALRPKTTPEFQEKLFLLLKERFTDFKAEIQKKLF